MEAINYNVLGVMSGTSLDGIDLVQVRFTRNGDWKYEILAAETIGYSPEWRKQLAAALDYNDLRLQEFNQEYTTYLAEVIYGFIQKHEIRDLDLISSHGHTVRHEPEKGLTLQIGNLPKLAKLLGQLVICDFRVQDVEKGGQGAPLVPVGDELLFPEYDYCLNLGGFANISTRREHGRTAYDICAVNTVLNHLAERLGMEYDKDGEAAASGTVDPGLLEKFNALEFYKQDPPKSLGIEWVREQVFPLLDTEASVPDLLRTYTVHAAQQIAKELKTTPGRLLVTGGGAYNACLIREIRDRVSGEVVIPSGGVVDFKEALIFGLLGVLKLRGEVNVLRSVTGASEDHSSGVILEP